MKWKFKDWGDKYADVNINFEEDEDEVSQTNRAYRVNNLMEMLIFPTFLFLLCSRKFLILTLQEVIIEVSIRKIPAYDTYGKHVHLDNLENGWRQNIFERISKTFGYPLKK